MCAGDAVSLMAAFAFIGLFITPRGVKAFLVHRV